MTLTNLSPFMQNLYILDYEQRVKNVLLIGLFIFSLFYIFWLHKNQKETDYFIVASVRTVLYVGAYLYSWFFFLLYVVFIHPNVPIDNLLLLLFSLYSILFTVWTIIFLFNAWVYIPKAVLKLGKLNVNMKDADLISKKIIDSYFKNFQDGKKSKKKYKIE